MKYYQILLITLVPLTLILVISRVIGNRNNNKKEKSVLRIPKFYRIVPLLLFCFSVIASVCILVFHFDDWPLILIWLGFFGVPSLVMFITWSLWKVEIKDGGIVFRSFWGRKHEYKYKELEYREHPKGLKWYFYKNNKRVLCIAHYIEGGAALDKLYHKYLKRVDKD